MFHLVIPFKRQILGINLLKMIPGVGIFQFTNSGEYNTVSL